MADYNLYKEITQDLYHVLHPDTMAVASDTVRGWLVIPLADGKPLDLSGYTLSLWSLSDGKVAPVVSTGEVLADGRLALPIDYAQLNYLPTVMQIKAQKGSDTMRFPPFAVNIKQSLDDPTDSASKSKWEQLFDELEKHVTAASLDAQAASVFRDQAEACQIKSCKCAETAVHAKENAETAATDSSESAASSAASASDAKGYAGAAEESATQALASKENARQYAENAKNSAGQAKTSADKAAESETGAKAEHEAVIGIKNTIVTDEKARQEAEQGRAAAEELRANKETERATAEETRVASELQRKTDENLRAEAEKARASSETSRATDEATRKSQELERVQAEAARRDSETTRDTSEQARVAAENDRVRQEGARASAETTRQQQETDRKTAENLRATEETTRAANERTRQQQETDRQAAESDRVAADTARAKQASDDHIRADKDHQKSLSDQAEYQALKDAIAGFESGQIASDVAEIKANKADKSYVDQRFTDLVGAAPEALDTLEEIAAQLAEQGDVGTALTTELGKKASKTEVETQIAEAETRTDNKLSGKADKTDVQASLAKKVDVVAGKGLSTNDFTDAAKQKVDAIPSNPKYTDTTYKLADGQTAGLSLNNYSTTEKQKLAGVEENANNYVLPTASKKVKGGVIIGDGITVSASGEISAQKAELANGTEPGLSLNNYSAEDKQKVTGLVSLSNTEVDQIMLSTGA